MKNNTFTCLVYIVCCVLLFGFYIWYWTLVTGSLRTATLNHVDCPCLIRNARVDCRWIFSKLVIIPSCRTANVTCLGRRGNTNIEMYQVLCVLSPQYTLMLKQYTNSDNECSCQLLNIQDCTGINQTNLTSALWNNPPLYSRPRTTKINKEIAVSKSPLKKREVEDSLSLIVTSPTDDFIIYFTLANKNPVKVSLNAYAIDYDPLEDRIYFTAQFGTSIYSAFSNGTDKTVIATAQIDTKPRGIAVDSLSRLLFYSEENRGYIALITMSTSLHIIVINNGLVKPGAMAVNMLESTLCWIDSGTKKIECANYDGSDRRDVVNSDLHNLFGLALDATNKYIYWSDGNRIERCDLDGRDRKVIHSTAPTSRFNGLSLSASHLYAIQYVTGAAVVRSYVYRYESDNTSQTKIFEDSSQLHDIHILSSVVSKGKTICDISHHGCSHICIPIRDNKSTCLCPEELSLGSDEKTCLQIGHTETVIIIPVTVCTAIALLVAIVVSVLVIKRRWLCFAKRSQDIETSAVRDVDADEGRPKTGSNENSEIYDEIVDVLEDLITHPHGEEEGHYLDHNNIIDLDSVSPECSTDLNIYDEIVDVLEDLITHPHGEEEGHYLDHYNIIDMDSVSPECSSDLIPDDNKESFAQCGLDNENYLIPVCNDGYITPICESHPGPQSNMDEHSDSVFNVEVEADVNAPGCRTPHSSLKEESLLSETADCPTKVNSGVSRTNSDTEENYFSHFVNESSNPVLDPNVNGHTKCTRESVAYLTLSPQKSDTEGSYYSHLVNESSNPVLDPNVNGHTKCTRESVAYLTLSPQKSDTEGSYYSHLVNESSNPVLDPNVNGHTKCARESVAYLTLSPQKSDTEGSYYSHLVNESSNPVIDPNVNGHTKCTRESVAYLTLSPHNSDCGLPTRLVSSEMLPEVNDSQNYINQNSNIISDKSNYLTPLSSVLRSTEPGSDKDVASYHYCECASTVPVSDKDISSYEYCECASTVPVSDKDISLYEYCECASTNNPVTTLSDQNILHE